MCISAGTGAGLNTVNLSELNTFQQVVLYLLIVLGSPTLVFTIFVNVRRVNCPLAANPTSPSESGEDVDYVGEPSSAHTWDGESEELEETQQAFALLSWLVPLYLVTFQLLGSIALGSYIAAHTPEIPAVNHVNPWWLGSFNAISAFNNSGMSLLDANMSPFQQTYFVLATMSVLILAGNTCFPIALRVSIWCLSKCTPPGTAWKPYRRALTLLLTDRSRAICPYMFTRGELLWLAASVLVLNGVDWAAFGISSVTNPNFDGVPATARVFQGLFQAFSVRSGGFAVVTISQLSIAVQTLYLLMMYISSFPISPDTAPSTPPRLLPFLRRQITRMFALDDFWPLAAATWIICVLEAPHAYTHPLAAAPFGILFETVSAYGCVGVSVGAEGSSTSLAGSLAGGSKGVLCAVMIWGRTREVRKGVLVGGWGIGGEEVQSPSSSTTTTDREP